MTAASRWTRTMATSLAGTESNRPSHKMGDAPPWPWRSDAERHEQRGQERDRAEVEAPRREQHGAVNALW